MPTPTFLQRSCNRLYSAAKCWFLWRVHRRSDSASAMTLSCVNISSQSDIFLKVYIKNLQEMSIFSKKNLIIYFWLNFQNFIKFEWYFNYFTLNFNMNLKFQTAKFIFFGKIRNYQLKLYPVYWVPNKVRVASCKLVSNLHLIACQNSDLL